MLGQKNYPIQIALKKNIPLVFYGENEAEHGNPIGDNQTISQPFVVAKMTQLLEVESTHKVLEKRMYETERVPHSHIHDTECYHPPTGC